MFPLDELPDAALSTVFNELSKDYYYMVDWGDDIEFKARLPSGYILPSHAWLVSIFAGRILNCREFKSACCASLHRCGQHAYAEIIITQTRNMCEEHRPLLDSNNNIKSQNQ